MRKARRARRASGMEKWLALAEERVERRGVQEEREQFEHARQQVDLCRQYDATCAKLRAFSRSVRLSGDLLVPMRFPVRPTARNRQSISDGMMRSFTHFVRELSALSLTTNAHRLECVRHDPDAPLVGHLASVLALESGRVLDRLVAPQEAVDVCIRFIEARRLALVREECAALQAVRASCLLVSELMQLFCKRQRALKRSPTQADVVAASRAWLRTAARGQGLSHAVHALCRRRRMALFFDAHPWLTRQYADFSDEEALAVWNTLIDKHEEFSQFVEWEVRRIDWLCAANAANTCWDGVALSAREGDGCGDARDEATTWATTGVLVHAPAHIGTFATLERVHLVGEVQTAPYSCHMATVRVANVLVELLRTRRLVLDKISAEYAARIAAFDYAKYESARRRIVEDTLKPFGEVVGVSYGA